MSPSDTGALYEDHYTRDREADTVRIGIFREAAQFLARLYMQHIRPLPFDRVFYIDGIRVRVTIDEYKKE